MTDQQQKPDEESRVDAVLADYFRLVDAGEQIDREQFLRERAADSDELRDLLSTADLVQQMAGPVVSGDELEETVQLASSAAGNLADASDGEADTFAVGGGAAGASLSQPTGLALPCEFGDYTLLEMIGRGGMGVVYKAQQRGIGRIVAVKMIASGRVAGGDDVQRFYTEAQAAGKLAHPNIVTIHQAGEIDGRCYFSMDYIEGTDLAKICKHGPLDPRRAAQYLQTIAEAIQYAHDHGVLHRDLKPANVLVDENDRVLVTDFGLAKQLDRDQNLTATGAALGTPSYMSPEQAAGRHDAVGPASDVYSLGAILYVLLTGHPPFRGESAVETIFSVIHDNPPPPRKLHARVDRDLETICLRCLHKNPRKRYGSARELADDLGRYLRGEPIHARPISKMQRAWWWLRDVPLVAALAGSTSMRTTPTHRRVQGAAILLSILLVVAFFSWRVGRQHLLPRRIVMSSGLKGQLYYEVCDTLKPVLENISQRPVDVLESNGSEQNVKRVVSGEAHAAIAQAETLTEQTREICPLYFDVVQVVARKESGIDSINDLAGRRVSIGPELSGMRHSAVKLLQICGVDPDSLQQSAVPFTRLLDDPSYEAAVITTGFDNPDRNRLLASGRVKLIPFSRDELRRLTNTDFRPFLIEPRDVPATIELPAEGLRTVATTAYLIVRRDASARLVRTLLDALYQDYALFERHDILIPRQEAATWGHAHWHPAAQEYFVQVAAEQQQ